MFNCQEKLVVGVVEVECCSLCWWYEVEGWNESAGCGYPLYLQSTCTVDDERIFTEP